MVGGRVELTGTQIEESDAIRDGGGVLALQTGECGGTGRIESKSWKPFDLMP